MGARIRAPEDALHLWEDQSWLLVKTSAPTRPGLRSAVTLRSLAIQATPARDAGSETTAWIPCNPGTAALACAASNATGTPKNGAAWALTTALTTAPATDQTTAPTMDLTAMDLTAMDLTAMDLTMASTMAQALTKRCNKASNIFQN